MLAGFDADPLVARVQQIVAAQPAPVSLARTSYRALHAYRFINADGHGRWARYHWEPAAGVEGQAAANMAALPHNFLFDELDDRLTREPATFALELQLAADDDPVHDVSAFWPENRERVTVERVQLVRPISLEEIGDPVMMHDPTRVTDGIETHPRRRDHERSSWRLPRLRHRTDRRMATRILDPFHDLSWLSHQPS